MDNYSNSVVPEAVAQTEQQNYEPLGRHGCMETEITEITDRNVVKDCNHDHRIHLEYNTDNIQNSMIHTT